MMRRFLLLLMVAALCCVGAVLPGFSFVISHGDSSATIEPGTVGTFRGLQSWVSGGQSHGVGGRQWFWWRPALTGERHLGKESIAPVVTPMGANKAKVAYSGNQFFSADVIYELTDGPGPSSTLKETITITNKWAGGVLDLTWFAYYDPLVGSDGVAFDDVPSLLSPLPLHVRFTDGPSVIEMRTVSISFVDPFIPSTLRDRRWEIDKRPDILNEFTGVLPNTAGAYVLRNLNDWVPGTQATAAFQWDMTLGTSSSVTIVLEKAVNPPIPEPSTWALFSLGAIGLLAWRRRSIVMT